MITIVMQNIEVFYHVLIPADLRASTWTWWVDQQLTLIVKSKLHNIAKINMAITMPYDWTDLFGAPITLNHNPTYQISFGEKVKEYINSRYPFVNIISVRHTSDTNIFEGQTLSLLHKRCCEADINVCYIHTKGVANAMTATASWREVLNHFIITEWAKCVALLKNSDVVGVKDNRTYGLLTSGNFWWSKSSHISRLPNPLDSHVYLPDNHDVHPGAVHYRYAFERWVMPDNTNVSYIADTKTDHYNNYCFLEDMIQTTS